MSGHHCKIYDVRESETVHSYLRMLIACEILLHKFVFPPENIEIFGK